MVVGGALPKLRRWRRTYGQWRASLSRELPEPRLREFCTLSVYVCSSRRTFSTGSNSRSRDVLERRFSRARVGGMHGASKVPVVP